MVGSGPAGLVAAWDLARRGARVCVVERHDRAGGLLMYGIPNMKLDKSVVKRRVDLMAELGIEFRLGVDAADVDVAAGLAAEFDAVVVAAGACKARGVGAEGFDAGVATGDVVYAVDYLTEQTRALLEGRKPAISAEGKDVVVIGGGDTGNDCMGTAVRQGARTVRQLEYGPRAPKERAASNLWPEWPNVAKTDYGQEEAIALQGDDLREWCADTQKVLLDERRTCARSAGAFVRLVGSASPSPWKAPSARSMRSWCWWPAASRVRKAACSTRSACRWQRRAARFR